MNKLIIGIAGNYVADAGEGLHHLPIDYLPSGYAKAVQLAGGLPLILPLNTPETAGDYITQIDKLILAGGQNVAPKFYGAKLETAEDESCIARDEFELALIKEAVRQEKPIFAVCRGMQLLNVFFGGTLIQKLPETGEIQHMQDPIPSTIPTHELLTKEGSVLQKIYGSQTKVNSFHYQAIRQLAENFTRTAWSPDHVVEGIEDSEKRLVGVQWHPDFAFDSLEQEQRMFDYVVHQL